VIDVGSNTIRLLVADVGGRLEVVREERVWARLGADVAKQGSISDERLGLAVRAVSELAIKGRKLGCDQLEVVVASPGRQAANAHDLVRLLRRAGGVPVRVLSREEEAWLGFRGGLASIPVPAGAVAVCDVGGGSTQLAVGAPCRGPSWLESIDVGSLRLTTAQLDGNPPGKKAVRRARAFVARELDRIDVPAAERALAIGGSARALRRIVGSCLGEEELRDAVTLLGRTRSRDVVRAFCVPRARARTLVAGAVILAEVQRRIGVPLEVVRGGIREGAVLELAARAVAA
jgi:exopolyphosphatase/guanosine-5'-triphosphate,3'-diphosphate pyrophosphatase